MRLVGFLASAAVAALAVTAIATASASAGAPEFGRCLKQAGGKFSDAGCTKAAAKGKFEWTSVILHNKFNGAMKKKTLATLETVGGTKITCTSEENKGAEFSAPKKVSNLIARFSGCETSGIKCNSAGEAPGKITTFTLEGLLAVASVGKTPAENPLEVQLFGPAHGALAAFSCGPVAVEVSGCIAHPVPSNKMLLTSTEVFSAEKGEQNIDKVAGGAEDECALASKTGTGTEEAGQTITATIKGEEKIEASSVN